MNKEILFLHIKEAVQTAKILIDENIYLSHNIHINDKNIKQKDLKTFLDYENIRYKLSKPIRGFKVMNIFIENNKTSLPIFTIFY